MHSVCAGKCENNNAAKIKAFELFLTELLLVIVDDRKHLFSHIRKEFDQWQYFVNRVSL